MNKVIRVICFWGAAFVINTNVFCAAYTFDVDIGCSTDPGFAYWYKYSVDAAKKNYRLSLYTIGIKKTDVITQSDDRLMFMKYLYVGEENGEEERVVATCEGGSFCSIEVQEPGSRIVCSPGESLSVVMRKPNSLSPQKYRYIGLLIIEDLDIAEVEAADASKISSLCMAGLDEEEDYCLINDCGYSRLQKDIADLEGRVLSPKAYDAVKARLKPQLRYSDTSGNRVMGKRLIKLTIQNLFMNDVMEDKGEMWFFADIVPPEIPVAANTVITFSPQPQKH